MSREAATGLGYILIGSITATGIGQFLFQAIGALILGIMGAIGGYLFNRFIRHRIEKLINRISKLLKKDKPKAE